MIPFYDFKRELKYKQETIADVFCTLLYSIALVACIIGLVLSSLERDILTIGWCSLFLPIITCMIVLHICWAVRDYKKYKLVREINKTALEIKVLDVLTSAIIEAATRKDKEKATKTTTKKKTARKRKWNKGGSPFVKGWESGLFQLFAKQPVVIDSQVQILHLSPIKGVGNGKFI